VDLGAVAYILSLPNIMPLCRGWIRRSPALTVHGRNYWSARVL